MRHSRPPYLAGTLGLLACLACAEPSADVRRAVPEADEGPHAPSVALTDTATGVDPDCGFVRTAGHSDPDSLITEYLRRDAAGEFMGPSEWIFGAIDCPDHEGGPDTYTLIASYEARPIARSDTSLAVEVRSRQLGLVSAGGAGLQFHEEVAEVVDTVRARRTGYGWRIASPALRLMVRVDAPAERLELHAGDSARVVELLRGPTF